MVSSTTKEAREGLENILDYLDSEFGINYGEEYVVDYWHTRFILESMPYAFPVASYERGIRKLVFRKRTTIYYRIHNVIEILAIIDNRRDFKLRQINSP
jgi:plasmid stabilization system protein ParE